jgi:uncharacterized membrane protein YeiB
MQTNKQRITGLDFARALSILGMIFVNYNMVLGNPTDSSWLGIIIHNLSGNSSATFVMLAGAGLTLMCYKPHASESEKQKYRFIALKRSLFLFILGLLLYTVWSGDILHFYAGYMLLGAWFLYRPLRNFIWSIVGLILSFFVLVIFFDYSAGWEWATLTYTDFWSFKGLLRNIFFNGWHPICPWLAFYLIGMLLGRIDWNNTKIIRKLWIISLSLIVSTQLISLVGTSVLAPSNQLYPLFDISTQIPPLPFYMLSSIAISLLIILVSVWFCNRFGALKITDALCKTGQLSLTHYLLHILVGITGFLLIFHPEIHSQIEMLQMSRYSPLFITVYATTSFVVLVIFSVLWKKKFKQGPLETIMRKITG